MNENGVGQHHHLARRDHGELGVSAALLAEPGHREHPLPGHRARPGRTRARTDGLDHPSQLIYFSSLLDRTPKAQPAEPRSWRKDEYPG